MRPTEASERCRLRGAYTLRTGKGALELWGGPEPCALLYDWPYRFLRRFGRDKVRGAAAGVEGEEEGGEIVREPKRSCEDEWEEKGKGGKARRWRWEGTRGGRAKQRGGIDVRRGKRRWRWWSRKEGWEREQSEGQALLRVKYVPSSTLGWRREDERRGERGLCLKEKHGGREQKQLGEKAWPVPRGQAVRDGFGSQSWVQGKQP